MKLAFLTIAAVALISNLAAAWDVDGRCTRRRELEGFRFEEAEQRHKTKISGKNLRRPDDGHLEVDALYFSNVEVVGETVSEAVDTRRELQSSIVFQLKMYWEEGYCWQEEWDERRWCLQCEGSSCGENDYLLIEECSSSSRQQFVFQDEKLKPYTRQDLCWTRTRDNAHQLKPCGNDDTQFIKGLKYDGNFEMHPNGSPNDCLVNHHHPKSGEIIRRQSCEAARNDKTSLWVMIDKDGGGGGGGGGDGGNGGSNIGNTQDKGREYCDSTECGLCEGDCDSDDQCKGSLMCYQRGSGDPLPPGCSGGPLNTDTDFCYDPGGGSGGGGGGGGDTKVEDMGSEYCDSTECGLCQGDCDSDDQCAGGYKCYQRSSGDPLPRGCSGVPLSSNSDLCYDPGAYE